MYRWTHVWKQVDNILGQVCNSKHKLNSRTINCLLSIFFKNRDSNSSRNISNWVAVCTQGYIIFYWYGGNLIADLLLLHFQSCHFFLHIVGSTFKILIGLLNKNIITNSTILLVKSKEELWVRQSLSQPRFRNDTIYSSSFKYTSLMDVRHT